MRWATYALCVLAPILSGCARVSDKVFLLPGPDGRTGALTVGSAAGEIVLSEPYTGVAVVDGQLSPTRTSAGMVRDAYGRLLAMQPARPQILVLHFEFGRNVLTPESRTLLPRIRALVATLPAGEAVVIGHTDRVGPFEANDRLSLQRAALVRELLVDAGVARDAITVVGRGEREPLVVTADNVAEARNRRVEIKLR